MQKHTFPTGSTAMEMATVCSRTGKGAVCFNYQVTNLRMEVRYKLSCIALPDTADTLIKGNQRHKSNSFIQNFSAEMGLLSVELLLWAVTYSLGE